MIKKIALFGVLGIGLLSAKTFTFTVTSPTTAGSSQLKPGDYKLKVDGSQGLLMDRKGHTLDTGKVVTADHKFSQTSIASSTASGANKLESIEFAGSNTKVVFE